jgi:phage shock protein A
VTLLLLLVAGGYGFAGDLFVEARDVAALREERESLAAEVERLTMKLAVESATRLQLEKQSAELNAQVAELNGQVKFLMVRKAPDKIVE